MPFERDPSHWLLRLSPREWIRLGLEELERAEAAFSNNQTRAGYVGAKRAAGMALNGALIVAPCEAWGRSYVDHIAAIAKDETVLNEVREAAQRLVSSEPPGGSMVTLRSRSGEQRLLDAAKTVMAHAFAIVLKAEPSDSGSDPTS
jgi:HEPN domain-containing protein